MFVVVGLDLGTTVIKAAAYNTGGRLLAVESVATPSVSLEDGSLTVPPDDLVTAAMLCVSRFQAILHNRSIGCVGISSSMFSVFPIGPDNKPLGPSKTWADANAIPVEDQKESKTLYNLTGCRIFPAYPRERIRTTAREQPEIFNKAARWVSLAEYLFFRWTGKWAISKSIASSTGLLDIHSLNWSPDALAWSGITESKLSPLTDETYAAPAENEPCKGSLVAIGATDGPLCQIGTNSLLPGEMTSTIGTSGALRMVSNDPVLDPKMRTWCYYLTNGLRVYGGATNGGALALNWLVDDILGLTETNQDSLGLMINEAIRTVPPGCEGLSFIPLLIGERFPDWNPKLKGLIEGLSLSHSRLHLVRAALEGTMFRLRTILYTLIELGRNPGRIRATGGYTQNRAWLQMQADAFGLPIEVPDVDQASAFGAACLAAEAAGIKSAADMSRTVGTREVLLPHPELYDAYQEAYLRSQKLYEQMRVLYK